MDRPRLLIAVTSPMSAGFFQGQLAWLRDQGFDVHFLCGPGQPAESIVAAQHATFHGVSLARNISPWRDLCALWRIIGVLRRVRPQIVNAGTPKAGMLVMFAAWLCRVPVRIYTVHGLRFETVSGPLRGVLITIERMVCACATLVLCVGPGLRGLVLQNHLCAATKVTVPANGSANGIDLEEFHRPAWMEQGLALRRSYAIPPDAPVIGFVGRLVRDKGIAELSRTWQSLRLQHPTAHLLIVGDVESGDPVSAKDQAALRNDERVHITGFVSEVRPGYAAMQVLVLPTYREGLPTVLLEAGAMALPAVASAIPGCRDVLVSGVTGMLVTVGDITGLETALAAYLTDPALAIRHGAAAQRLVAERFDHQVVWLALSACYRDTIAERTAR